MYSSLDTIWTLLASALVFFMQAGFAMLEAGFTRAKNAGNIIMKNLMDFCMGTLLYWLLGFGLMYGATKGGFFGTPDFIVKGTYTTAIPTFAFLIFQTVFCGTATTIVSGAMAERTKFSSYLIYSIVISGLVYPISGHWIWNSGGWLRQIGFHDFAGSTAVHLVGGISSLVGAKILGPRIGKYSKDGHARAIPGHNLTIGALGIFILWFCWFGFNGGSTLSATGDDTLLKMSRIFVNTNISAAASAAAAMIITWSRYRKPDVTMTLNGALAGLVAVTAGCDLITPVGALFTGLTAGIVVVMSIEFVDRILKIDDPVGAIGVHGFCGATGTILTGLFAEKQGVFYGGGGAFLQAQVIGVLSVGAWVAAALTITFLVIKHTIGLRVSSQEEMVGLDIEEHGLYSSYADFMPVISTYGSTHVNEGVPLEKAVEVSSEFNIESVKADGKIYNVVIVINQNKFERLKTAMEDIGITGMTVINAIGCGMQKGHLEYYRGAELEMNLLPKVIVKIVIHEVPLRVVIETAKRALYTGRIGDGKIFVNELSNVIKVRTGEEGGAAL